MADADTDARAAAIKRIKAKRDFRNHVAVFVVINLMLVAIWALAGGGYFWPAWSIFGWGIGLAFHGYSAYVENRPISEDEIRRELDRDRGLGA